MKYTRLFLAILFLGFLTFIYFSDVIFSGQIFSFRDLSRYYYPFRLFAFNEIKAGSFPFWNPYVGSGHPLFAALQSVVLYPISIIYLLFNFDFAFNFFIIFHIYLAGLFFYLLMRDLKFNNISSLAAGISFMFGGYLIAVINLTTTLAAAVWFPLVFLFYNRAIQNKKIINIALSSVFLGLMFLGGEPTPMYGTVLMMGLYAMWHRADGRSIGHELPQIEIELPRIKAEGREQRAESRGTRAIKEYGWNFMVLGGIILIFILLFMFQILPFVELIKLSNRGDSSFEGAAYWSFPPRDLINLLLPFFYGPLHFQDETPMRQDWLLLSYVGVIPLVLFLIALIFRRDKYSNYFKIVFFLGLLFVFGRFTPVYKLFYKFMPGFGLIRYPVKFFFISAAAFSFLAGAGWQEYCERVKLGDERFVKFIKRMFIIGFSTTIVFFIIYIFKNQIISYVMSYIDALKDMDDPHKLKYFTIFTVDLYNFRRVLLFFIVGSLFLFIGARTKIKLSVAGSFILAFTFIDLYGGKNIDVNPVISRETLHKETSHISFLRKDKGLFRIYTSSKMNKENEVLRGTTYDEAFAVGMDHLSSNRLIEFGLYDSRGYFSIHNLNYCKIINVIDTSPYPSSTNLLNMLNVKYILTPKDIEDPFYRLVNISGSPYRSIKRHLKKKSVSVLSSKIRLFSDVKAVKHSKAGDTATGGDTTGRGEKAQNIGPESYLYENLNFMPRAFIVPEINIIKNEVEVAEKMRGKKFHPDGEVILEEDPILNCKLSAVSGEEEYAEIVKYEGNTVVIEVNIKDKPKFLVLADNYYPGWNVFIDGQKDKIYKADFILRGVYLNTGKHKVEFVFRPVSFTIGVMISLVALLVVIILVVGQNGH